MQCIESASESISGGIVDYLDWQLGGVERAA